VNDPARVHWPWASAYKLEEHTDTCRNLDHALKQKHLNNNKTNKNIEITANFLHSSLNKAIKAVKAPLLVRLLRSDTDHKKIAFFLALN